ncbi:MAG: sigma-70 family RNA polymerase sigma factor [Anaerolineales bacterium]|nr:MAG: sigma-70 family RNA polymerase sigma factor [Anaerolineales bacterium]
MDEISLVAQARQGSQSAWAELVRLHQQAVFRLAYLHLGDAAEAQDAAQDCFVRAFRHLGRFDAQRPLRPWLLRIVANLARNRRRSAGRYWAALQRAARQQPQAADSPQPGREAAEQAEELWAAVRRLPQRQQTVLYLRYFLELSVEEAAQALDLPVGTVKSQTHRALQKLHEVIRADFPQLVEDRYE